MRWFNYNEFDSPDAPGSGNLMEQDFLEMLDDSRNVAGIPFIVTSGYRTPDWNAHIGGVNNSSHCKGCAADIAVANARERFLILTALLEVGFDRIGIYEHHIHVDNDWEKDPAVIWYI